MTELVLSDTTYTVGEGTACEDSAQLAVTVIGSGAAGADNSGYCSL